MLRRHLGETILRLAKSFPVIAITGPRQSGKTTLARALFPDKPYVSLENPSERLFAQDDPQGFLARFPNGAIFDEAQRWPDLFSWLQGRVDDDRRAGRFVLTGSQQFGLHAGITQSLAGRVGMSQLLPFSLSENPTSMIKTLDATLLMGSYPAVVTGAVSSQDWFPSYVATYVERDVRQLIRALNLSSFQRFIKLCAARTGQLLNLAALASEAGISETTARSWLSVLEASFLVIRLPPYHQNFGKRLIKSPKLYFLDTGLACWLLGIHSEDILNLHPLRGALFETWVVTEFIKNRFNQGLPSDLYFWRDSNGLESDLVFESRNGLQTVEIKSGQTITRDYIQAAQKTARIASGEPGHALCTPWLIHGGTDDYERSGVRVIPWMRLFAEEGHGAKSL